MSSPLNQFQKSTDREPWAKIVDLALFDKATTYALAHLTYITISADAMLGARLLVDQLRMLSQKPGADQPDPSKVKRIDHTQFDSGRRAKSINEP